MSLVLDTSVTLSWYFEDERTPASLALLHRVAQDCAVVPVLWRLEMANGFASAIRRKRIDRDYRDASLIDLAAMPIAIDPETDSKAWSAFPASRRPVQSDHLRCHLPRTCPASTAAPCDLRRRDPQSIESDRRY